MVSLRALGHSRFRPPRRLHMLWLTAACVLGCSSTPDSSDAGPADTTPSDEASADGSSTTSTDARTSDDSTVGSSPTRPVDGSAAEAEANMAANDARSDAP